MSFWQNHIKEVYKYHRISQVSQWYRICLPMQETQEKLVQSLGQEDPLEKGMATHPSILAGEIPWKEEAGKESDMT